MSQATKQVTIRLISSDPGDCIIAVTRASESECWTAIRDTYPDRFTPGSMLAVVHVTESSHMFMSADEVDAVWC